jgi:hypothetical protein
MNGIKTLLVAVIVRKGNNVVFQFARSSIYTVVFEEGKLAKRKQQEELQGLIVDR